jgi:hypothetical protein
VRTIASHGELGLDGRLRPAAGVVASAFAATRAGATEMIVSSANAARAALAPARVHGADSLRAVVEHLCGRAPLPEAAGADIAVAMVERRTLLARYPDSRRTWLKFRDGWWSGANIFWFGSSRARSVVALWQEVEQDRKKGWKILSAFGPLALLGAVLRISTLRGGIARVGRRFGLTARLVAMDKAEACIDADKPEDVVLIEQILAKRPQ